MIRALRLVDIPRQLLSGRLASRDLVYTRGTLGSPNPRLTNLNAARYGMPRARGYKAIGAFEDQRLEALAVLRSRSGPSAWEIARLFASANGYAQLDSLLSAGGRCRRQLRGRASAAPFSDGRSSDGASPACRLPARFR